MLQTPVALIIFNRPQTTAKVFAEIRKAEPTKLLVLADGPRSDRLGEAEKCAAARAIIETVDWECEVVKNYSDVNLGCKERIGRTGLTWIFQMVEEAIILEDDCLPDPTFFNFCQELLRRYRYDERIMSICGSNLLLEWKPEIQDYHFSNHFSAWGWASWRRVWELYDVDMKLWSEPEMQTRVKDALMHRGRFLKYRHLFELVYQGKLDAWDYQMLFHCLTQSGLSITPARNLISNLGFDIESTNTSSANDIRANLPTFPAKFPLREPIGVGVDRAYELKRNFKLYDRSLPAKLYRKLNKLSTFS